MTTPQDSRVTVEQAIRDYAEKHGPSGPAWNISAVLDLVRASRPSEAASGDDELVTQIYDRIGLRLSAEEWDYLRDRIEALTRAPAGGDEVVERVARAICIADCGHITDNELDRCRGLAIAALTEQKEA